MRRLMRPSCAAKMKSGRASAFNRMQTHEVGYHNRVHECAITTMMTSKTDADNDDDDGRWWRQRPHSKLKCSSAQSGKLEKLPPHTKKMSDIYFDG